MTSLSAPGSPPTILLFRRDLRLADKHIHCPWEATGTELASAGMRLGVDYPAPIVDHRLARRRALDAYARIKTDESDVTAHQNSPELAL